MEILFLAYNLADTCSFYRSAGVIKDLQAKLGKEHNITALQLNQADFTWPLISRFDIVMMQRPCTIESLSLCEYIKQLNIKLWVDWDDDLFHVNPENPTWFNYNKPEVQEVMKKILMLADVITVPTEYLRQVLSPLNQNIVVIPNAYNDTFFSRPEPGKRTNQVVWRGPAYHIKDIMTYREAIERALTDFTEWRYIFMGGINPSWFLCQQNNIQLYDMMDIAVYMKTLAELAPAAMHVPLHDNTFNHCKSNIAAIEGSYAGAVCIVPEWWNMPGTLSYTDNESYYESLRSVLSGEVDKVAQNIIAWEYIMDELRLSKVNVERLRVINSLS